MAIRSDKGCVGGQPRIEGQRIWISHIILNVKDMGLQEYLEDFDLESERDKIIEAFDYCRKEECVGKVVSYCQDCNKNSRFPGEDVWKIARELYEIYF